MYSRGLGPVIQGSIPEKYDGTALLDLPTDTNAASCSAPKFIDAQKNEVKISPQEEPREEQGEPCSSEIREESTAEAFSPTRWLRRIFPRGSFLGELLPKIELEELIIIGLALFLFFSKDGDRECALMLLALIFIG